MTRPYADMQVNPFEDTVVREPREVSFSVPGLNDAPLNRLLTRFSALDADELPRSKPAKPDRAQLVVSPDGGYGKSHLLGRLFTALGRRATKVYLRPFQDPYKAWHSILLLTVQELDRPDDEAADVPSQPSSRRLPSAPWHISLRISPRMASRAILTPSRRCRFCASLPAAHSLSPTRPAGLPG